MFSGILICFSSLVESRSYIWCNLILFPVFLGQLSVLDKHTPISLKKEVGIAGSGRKRTSWEEGKEKKVVNSQGGDGHAELKCDPHVWFGGFYTTLPSHSGRKQHPADRLHWFNNICWVPSWGQLVLGEETGMWKTGSCPQFWRVLKIAKGEDLDMEKIQSRTWDSLPSWECFFMFCETGEGTRRLRPGKWTAPFGLFWNCTCSQETVLCVSR